MCIFENSVKCGILNKKVSLTWMIRLKNRLDSLFFNRQIESTFVTEPLESGGRTMVNREIKEELINGLCGIFGSNILQIILYGSVARNEAMPESDIDVAIILKGRLTAEKREPFMTFAANLDMKYGRVFSIIDIEQSNMEKWGNILPFYRNIQKEGIVLWKAA